MSVPTAELERIARELEESGDYRVLRRLKPRTHVIAPDGTDTKIGIFLDVETTGLDLARSEVIEFAMVPFEFSSDGRIFRVSAPLQQFNEPVEPIPPEISALTGITDQLVGGHHLDKARIETFADPAALIIAHNAAFDRPFAERISPLFKAKPWACSMNGIPWKDEGIEGRRLKDLLAQFGFFFDGHRASEDCLAAVELLTMTLPKSGRLVMTALLEQARVPICRISAEGAPFEAKDNLKARGYRWNTRVEQGPRAWWIEVPADRVESELAFLEHEVFHRSVNVPIRKITAFERFSTR
jgi:DNA polymerase-3 subunit epsilon